MDNLPLDLAMAVLVWILTVVQVLSEVLLLAVGQVLVVSLLMTVAVFWLIETTLKKYFNSEDELK